MNPTTRIMEQVNEHLKAGSFQLHSSQEKLCLPIVNRLCRKMQGGISFIPIKVVEGLIIDGHHRYVASILAGVSIEKIATRKSSASKMVEWKDVIFVAEDWDTEAKIEMLNAQDALYNGVSISAIHSMLK